MKLNILHFKLQTAAVARHRRAQAARRAEAGIRDPSPSDFAPLTDDIPNEQEPNSPLTRQQAAAGRTGKGKAGPGGAKNGARQRNTPKAGTSNGNQNGAGDHSSDEDADQEPAFEVHSKKRRKSAAETRTELVNILHGRTNMLERLTDAVGNNNPRAEDTATVDDDTAIAYWGHITANKAKAMGGRRGRHFMLRVDTMAAEELDEMEQ